MISMILMTIIMIKMTAVNVFLRIIEIIFQGSQIIYAWAMDAKSLELPKGVSWCRQRRKDLRITKDCKAKQKRAHCIQ